MTQITAQLGHGLARSGARSLRRPAARPDHRPPALVAVAHGSRDPAALRTLTALLAQVRSLRPGLPVRLGHIELNEPLLSDTLATMSGEAVLVPLLLGRGYHVKQDLPRAVAAAPGLSTRIAAPLGPHPLLAEVLHDRLTEAGLRRHPGAARSGGVVLAAAGSRDPDSAADTARMAQLLSARLGGVPVVAAYASATTPTVADAVNALVASDRRQIALASYFTAPGLFPARCAAAAPGVAAAPLGAHPALAHLLLHRYDQALRGAAPSPPENLRLVRA